MGTNYYWHKDGAKLHIGKSSGGWAFALHVYPELDINSLDDWKDFIHSGEIYDEYNDYVTPTEMLDIIINRHWESDMREGTISDGTLDEETGILHRRIDGDFVVGRGKGTWDYLKGDFS